MDTSFKSLDQIVADITEQVKKLNQGSIDTPEVELLTSNAQELYERLVVIRHKAFEKMATREVNVTEAEDEAIIPVVEEKEDETFFDLTSEENNSTNEAETDMLFDFGEPVEEEKTSTKKESIIKDNHQQTSPKSINETFEGNHSLNDVFKSAQQNSLADKLKFSPIKDLKSHININQKFSFISKLFNGDNDSYNAAIEKLNSFEIGDDARNYLNTLSQQQNWDAEDENVVTFVELVERRYM